MKKLPLLFLMAVTALSLRAEDARKGQVLVTCEGNVVGAQLVQLAVSRTGHDAELRLGVDEQHLRAISLPLQGLRETEQTIWYAAQGGQAESVLLFWDKKSGYSALDFRFRFPGELETSMENSLSVNMQQTNTYRCH